MRIFININASVIMVGKVLKQLYVESYIVRSIIICTHHLISLWWLNQGIWDGWGM